MSKSQEDFIVHLRHKYDELLPPLWAMVEIMTFGELSHWYENLKHRQDRNAISRLYDMDEKNLVSFLHHLNFVRNKCAHHNRLWNHNFTITLKLPKQRPLKVVASLNPNAERKLYNTLVILEYLLEIVSPNNHWKNRLFSLLHQHRIDIAQMGFPENHQSLAAWV